MNWSLKKKSPIYWLGIFLWWVVLLASYWAIRIESEDTFSWTAASKWWICIHRNEVTGIFSTEFGSIFHRSITGTFPISTCENLVQDIPKESAIGRVGNTDESECKDNKKWKSENCCTKEFFANESRKWSFLHMMVDRKGRRGRKGLTEK